MDHNHSDAAGTSRYLYAIVPIDFDLPNDLSGLDGQPVQRVCCGMLAAVISPTSRTELRPERGHLAAHWAVVNALMSVATVLPVAFGTIATSDDELRDFLSDGSDSFLRQLAYVHGAVEFGLRLRLNIPDPFVYLVDAMPELRAQRDALFGDGRIPGHHERIALGMQVERAIEQLREQQVSQLLPLLTPVCIDICRGPSHNAAELLNLACLVRRQDVQIFDTTLTDAADRLDDNLTVELSGPWAPHHFCSVQLGPGERDVPD